MTMMQQGQMFPAMMRLMNGQPGGLWAAHRAAKGYDGIPNNDMAMKQPGYVGDQGMAPNMGKQPGYVPDQGMAPAMGKQPGMVVDSGMAPQTLGQLHPMRQEYGVDNQQGGLMRLINMYRYR